MNKRSLTQEEREIERNADALQPVGKEKKRRIEKILEGAKKSQTISLRISAEDLVRIKERAMREGVPYQTLINSVLHKYVTHQLFDKNETIKTIRMLQESESL